jgi:hypothetical protein
MPIVEAGFGHFWLDLRFADLRNAVAVTEKGIDQHLYDFGNMLEEAGRAMPIEQFEESFGDDYIEWIRIGEQFPQILRRAMFILCYTRIEGLLNNLCRVAKQEQDLGLSLGDLNGMGIKRAKRYLTKLAGLTSPFQTSEWQQLTKYNLLRNILVHAEGRPTDLRIDGKLLEFVDEHPLLDLDQYGYVVISPGFCEQVIETARVFFEQFPSDLLVKASRYGI